MGDRCGALRRGLFGLCLAGCGDAEPGGDTDAGTSTDDAATPPPSGSATLPGTSSTTVTPGTAGSSSTDPSSTTGSSGSAESGETTGEQGPDCDIGEPVRARDETWTTIMMPGTACANAGEAGFVVNVSPRSTNLLIDFQGGGACFNEDDCSSSLLGGFNEGQGVNAAQGRSLFARDNPSNPFANWDYVFVPYCTGDFHSGDNMASYGSNHVGHANVTAFLTRIVPTFCDAERVVVTGTSAGGFGSTFAYPQIHEHFGSTPVDLIADSGPYMTPEHMPEAAQTMFDGNWGFQGNMPADCDACATRWDALYSYIAERWPDDRMSFLSYTRDPSIQGRFAPYTPLSDLAAFQTGINALADEVLEPLPNVRVFHLGGTGHVLLNDPSPFAITEGDTTLGEFIRAQLDGDDAAWTNVRPAP